MVFSSMTFIYFFLCLVILLYFPIQNRAWRNGVLLVASLVFYSWGEPRFVVMMIASALVAYLGGMAMYKKDWLQYRQLIFVLSVVLVTANLFIFKYFNFAVHNFEKLFGTEFGLKEIALPIGISFYTFQILSYIIDLYHGKVSLQNNFFYLLLYVAFFPQLIAGPIVRYSTIESEIYYREETIDDATYGARRFCVGLAKKVLLANGLLKVSQIVYAGQPEVYGSFMYWIAAIAYALHIYFDFSGYSDMAIALGRVFGFHFLENFDHPYTALSITEFWRKWHISLSSWFRDYIYIPLGGNRVSRPRWVLNIVVVWALTGLWHGASWNFVIWGCYYAVLLVLEKFVLNKYLEKLPKAVRWIYSAFFVLIGWVVFNLTDFNQMLTALKMMFNFTPCEIANMVACDSEIVIGLIYIPVGIVCMLPLGKFIAPKLANLKETKPNIYDIILNTGAFILFVLSTCFIVSTKFNPFIYFRF